MLAVVRICRRRRRLRHRSDRYPGSVHPEGGRMPRHLRMGQLSAPPNVLQVGRFSDLAACDRAATGRTSNAVKIKFCMRQCRDTHDDDPGLSLGCA